MKLDLNSDFEVVQFVFMVDKDTGKRHKLARIKKATKKSFPADQDKIFNNSYEVKIFFEGDESVFHFRNNILQREPHILQFEHSPEELAQVYQEKLMMPSTTIEEFLKTISYIVQLWKYSPSLLTLKRVG